MNTPLKQVRISLGHTQEAVASAVGIKQPFYSRIENGEGTPSPETAAKIARYFGHRISELQILFPERYMTDAPSGEAA